MATATVAASDPGRQDMLDLNHLRAFVVIAECGTISRAARRLAIAASPLGRQLKALERHLRQPLFDRRGRRLHLTPLGEALLIKAQALLGMAEDFTRGAVAAAADAAQVAGTVRLGLVPGIAWHPGLGRMMRLLRQRHPAMIVELGVDGSQFLVSGLRSGAFDLILLRRAASGPGLQTRLIGREELRLVAARDLGPLTSERLAGLPWLEPPGRVPAGLQQALDAAGLAGRQRMVVPDLAAAAAMARGGIGVLLTHASVAEALTGVQTMAPPFAYPAQDIHLGWRAGRSSNAVEVLRAVIGTVFAAGPRCRS